MPVQHESRRKKDHRKIDLASAALAAEPRWNKDVHSSVWDEDKLYDPDWEISDADLETYVDISLRD